jgi:hypothetical protein
MQLSPSHELAFDRWTAQSAGVAAGAPLLFRVGGDFWL